MNSMVEYERPLVSVAIMTYNHSKYIAKAIESVLMQKVNFKYEIVIAEDFSTDGTRKIVQDYYKKYPDKIRLVLQEKNVGMQANSDSLRKACRGVYRANLEGDDYWVSDNKLQYQVDFLENNRDFIAIGGNFKCVDEYGKECRFPWGDIRNTYCFDDEYTIKHLKKWLLFAHTSTVCFRNIFYDFTEEQYKKFVSVKMLGDRRLCLLMVLNGRVKHENKIWMVRRVLPNAASSFTNSIKNTNYFGVNFLWLCEAERYAKEQFGFVLDMSEKKEMWWKASVKLFLKKPNLENYTVMRYIFKKSNKKVRYIKLVIDKGSVKIPALLKSWGLKECLRRFDFVIRCIYNSHLKYSHVITKHEKLMKKFDKGEN